MREDCALFLRPTHYNLYKGRIAVVTISVMARDDGTLIRCQRRTSLNTHGCGVIGGLIFIGFGVLFWDDVLTFVFLLIGAYVTVVCLIAILSPKTIFAEIVNGRLIYGQGSDVFEVDLEELDCIWIPILFDSGRFLEQAYFVFSNRDYHVFRNPGLNESDLHSIVNVLRSEFHIEVIETTEVTNEALKAYRSNLKRKRDCRM